MKREMRTKVCAHCRGKGTITTHYAILTEDEQRAIFKREPKDIVGAPPEAERAFSDTGAPIYECCDEAVELARIIKKPVAFNFGGKLVVAYPDSESDQLMRKWWKEVYHKSYEESLKERDL